MPPARAGIAWPMRLIDRMPDVGCRLFHCADGQAVNKQSTPTRFRQDAAKPPRDLPRCAGARALRPDGGTAGAVQ